MNAEYKVFEAYLKLKEVQLYFSQLKEYSKLSNSSLQNVLNKLTLQKILEINKTKSNIFYKIKNKKYIGLKFSEIAMNKFEDLNIEIKSPLRNFLQSMPKYVYTVVLFGSASKKQEKKESDIDILVVSDKKINVDVKKIVSNYPISYFKCSISQFFKEDHLIIQAKKGFPIYKEQNFYEAILDEY